MSLASAPCLRLIRAATDIEVYTAEKMRVVKVRLVIPAANIANALLAEPSEPKQPPKPKQHKPELHVVN